MGDSCVYLCRYGYTRLICDFLVLGVSIRYINAPFGNKFSFLVNIRLSPVLRGYTHDKELGYEGNLFCIFFEIYRTIFMHIESAYVVKF